MAIELRVAANQQNLEQLRPYFKERCQELEINEKEAEPILFAAIKAFSAVCLAASGRTVMFNLRRLRWEISLRLEFEYQNEEEPLGLTAALYCPPAARTEFTTRGGRGIWIAIWENQ
ncbi:MAG: hypothetical protein PVG03_01630 [Desulfarculaceae bacterium]|jgi:hypothetical protein